MKIFDFPIKNKKIILALGAESAGNFSVYNNKKIYFFEDFGDLLDENNFDSFKKSVFSFLKNNRIKPEIIIFDLHPLMKTTLWGEKLAKKYKAHHIQVQHHHAHIFSAIGDSFLPLTFFKGEIERGLLTTINYNLPTAIYGISLDGTGFGEDEKIWGGEVFKLKMKNEKLKIIERIGGLENQVLLGGELAIQEPTRMIISILSKFLSKKEINPFVKKYYTKNEFELLYNQLEQNFNCLETSSTGRILDAVSLLLGFCKNERKYKHEPVDLLMANSTKPYNDIKPQIKIINISSMSNIQCPISNKFPITKFSNKKYILDTTCLFKYLIKNIDKDKKRLAATAQLYIAQGLHQIIKKHHSEYNFQTPDCHPELDSGSPTIFASGGISNNKIISNYFESKNIYLSKNIPRGDAGLSFGQIIHYLFTKK